MNTKSFPFKVEVEAVPYGPETVEYLFGKGAPYIADYSEDTMARDVIFELVKDAITYCLKAKMDFLVKTKQEPENMNERDKAFWDYLENKEQQYRKIEKTISSIPTDDGYVMTEAEANALGDSANRNLPKISPKSLPRP